MSDSVFVAMAPMLFVATGGVLLMLAEVFAKRRGSGVGPSADLAMGTFVTFAAGAVAALALCLLGPDKLGGAMDAAPYLLGDRFTLLFCFVLCLGGSLAALLAGGYLPEHRIDRGEFYPLLIFSTLGAMMLAAAGDLLSLFIGLETMSLGVYAMVGFRRGSPRSVEGAVKFFLLGAFATALLLYGGALLYGATGHTDLQGIGAAIRQGAATGANLGLLLLALTLILTGLAFMVSAVPFHMWTPDAYEGAPTPATTYMAVAVTSAAFAMMLRVLLVAFGDPDSMSSGAGWPPILAVLAVLTMTVANLVAARQASVKRMLAYSSIAHAGYLLVGVVAVSSPSAGADAQASVLFYLLAYTVSTAGAFGTLILCGSRGREAVSYDDLAGIGRRHPGAALALSLFMVSLAGLPPTAGFFGKLYLVRAAIGAEHYWLTVALVLNSVLAAYYYLRVMVSMYMREPAKGAPIAIPMRSGYVVTALLMCAAGVLLLGLAPARWLELAMAAALAAP